MDSALSVPEAKAPGGPEETGLLSAVCGAKSAGKTKKGFLRRKERGFPGGAVVESPPADAGDTGLCPGPG